MAMLGILFPPKNVPLLCTILYDETTVWLTESHRIFAPRLSRLLPKVQSDVIINRNKPQQIYQ